MTKYYIVGTIFLFDIIISAANHNWSAVAGWFCAFVWVLIAGIENKLNNDDRS